jgi:hypothetical protein
MESCGEEFSVKDFNSRTDLVLDNLGNAVQDGFDQVLGSVSGVISGIFNWW